VLRGIAVATFLPSFLPTTFSLPPMRYIYCVSFYYVWGEEGDGKMDGRKAGYRRIVGCALRGRLRFLHSIFQP
jgi:hypothetical protein